MKLPELWYIASPYSHNEPVIMSQRHLKVDEVMAKLYQKYKVAMIPPILVSRVIKDILGESIGTTFKEWKKTDLKYISRCDAVVVVMMDGWKESIGVQAEIRFAQQNKIIVKYLDPTTLTFREDK